MTRTVAISRKRSRKKIKKENGKQDPFQFVSV